MSNKTLIDDVDKLLDIWVAGWAGCRGFEVTTGAQFLHVERNDNRAGLEFFALEPDDAAFAALASRLDSADGGLATILTKDLQRFIALADQHGLEVESTEETMMLVDMDTQDTEDPWLGDDDLEVSYDGSGERYRIDVLAGATRAAGGDAFVVDRHVAVFDGIYTNPEYRRRGLGSFVMKALAAKAFENPVDTGLLLASAEGRALYNHLGWREVIPVISLKKRA